MSLLRKYQSRNNCLLSLKLVVKVTSGSWEDMPSKRRWWLSQGELILIGKAVISSKSPEFMLFSLWKTQSFHLSAHLESKVESWSQSWGFFCAFSCRSQAPRSGRKEFLPPGGQLVCPQHLDFVSYRAEEFSISPLEVQYLRLSKLAGDKQEKGIHIY